MLKKFIIIVVLVLLLAACVQACAASVGMTVGQLFLALLAGVYVVLYTVNNMAEMK